MNGYFRQWKISQSSLLTTTAKTIDCSSFLPSTTDIWEVLINISHIRDANTTYLNVYSDVTGSSTDYLQFRGHGSGVAQTFAFWLPVKKYIYLDCPSDNLQSKIFGYKAFN